MKIHRKLPILKPSLKRLGLALSLIVLVFSLGISLLSPKIASAASASYNNASIAAETEYRALVAFDALKFCINSDPDGELDKKNYNTAEVFAATALRDPSVYIGAAFEQDDGNLSCSDNGDLKSMVRAIGYEDIKDFMLVMYPQNTDCENKDACAFVGKDAIVSAMVNKITSSKRQGPDNNSMDLSPAASYWYWTHLYRNIEYGCGGINSNSLEKKIGWVPNELALGSDDVKDAYWYVSPDSGKVEGFKFALMKGDNEGNTTISRSEAGPVIEEITSNPNTYATQMGGLGCKTLSGKLSKVNAEAFAAFVDLKKAACERTPPDASCTEDQSEEAAATVDGAGGDDAGANGEESCETAGGDESWFMCPALKLIGGALELIDKTIASLLNIDRNKYNENDSLYQAWASFRNIALSLLIAAMLVMVISTALGFSFLDAYTVKKAFPRMVAAIIFILLSWFFCTLLIDISNTVGEGTLGIMLSPFPNAQEGSSLASMFVPSGGGDTISLAGGIGLVIGAISLSGGLTIILSWLASGLLVMVIAFFVLVARQMFIIVLILFTPVAILSWIFPGNDKLWKFWWQSFSKLLIMFPMIMALLASGRIFASVWQTIPDAGAEAILTPILKLTAYILPYAFIPFTFKAAGGVFGNLVGMANDRSRGAFDRLKKGRQKGMSDIGKRIGAGQAFRGPGKNFLNSASSGIAAGPRGWNPASARTRNAIRETKMTALGDSLKDNQIYQANKNNDMFLLAAADKDLAQKKIAQARENLQKAPAGSAEAAKYQQELFARESAMAMANAMPNKNNATRRQAALDLAATGYQFSAGEEGYNELRAIGQAVSGGDQGAYASFMNNAQYNLKGAGRFDLAGINNGASYDFASGMSKANGYQAGNAKPATHIAGAEQLLGKEFVKDGKTLKQEDFTSALQAKVESGAYATEEGQKAFASHHRNLLDAYNGATGANKEEIGKQLNAFDTVANSTPSTEAGIATVLAAKATVDQNKQDIYRTQPPGRALQNEVLNQ